MFPLFGVESGLRQAKVPDEHISTISRKLKAISFRTNLNNSTFHRHSSTPTLSNLAFHQPTSISSSAASSPKSSLSIDSPSSPTVLKELFLEARRISITLS